MFTLLKALLTLASSLASYMHDKKLMDAGAAQAILKGVNDANEAIATANAARNAHSVPESTDPDNRNNQK
jgi:hypothetical protein